MHFCMPCAHAVLIVYLQLFNHKVHSGSCNSHACTNCRKIQDQKIRRSFELQAKAYRASEVTSVFGNVNLDEDDYQQYEDEDIRSRTPDYTKTDIVLDELMNNND